MQTDIDSLERATLDAVAPLHTEEFPGWLLPFDPSHIGRATSAVPLDHHGLDSGDIAAIAARYAAHGLPAKFRVADVPSLAHLHAALGERGFAAKKPTLTQVNTVTEVLRHCTGTPATITSQPTPEWRAVYTAEGFDPVDGAERVQALSRSGTVVYASISDASGPLAAGTASFSQGWASFHGLRTVPQARGRGLARRILAGLAEAARAQGLQQAFLQVEEDNAGAVALYQFLGFRTAWRYLYWEKSNKASA